MIPITDRTSNLNEVKEIPQNQGTDQEQPGNGKQTLKHDYVKIPITDRPASSNEIKEVPQNQMTTEEQPGNDKVNPGNMEHQVQTVSISCVTIYSYI